jgi:Ca2+-binding EF-hand superfamily protein
MPTSPMSGRPGNVASPISSPSNKDAKSSSSSSSSAASAPKVDRGPSLLEKRMADKKELPLQVKMMLQKRPEMWADPQFAHNYPVEVWEHYDVNKDGILNKSELLVLAKDLTDRIVSMCKDGLKVQMPKSSESDLDKMIKKELPHILPAKTVEESRKMLAEHIYRELDIDKDGVITRTEFFYNWQGCSQKILDQQKGKENNADATGKAARTQSKLIDHVPLSCVFKQSNKKLSHASFSKTTARNVLHLVLSPA